MLRGPPVRNAGPFSGETSSQVPALGRYGTGAANPFDKTRRRMDLRGEVPFRIRVPFWYRRTKTIDGGSVRNRIVFVRVLWSY